MTSPCIYDNVTGFLHSAKAATMQKIADRGNFKSLQKCLKTLVAI